MGLVPVAGLVGINANGVERPVVGTAARNVVEMLIRHQGPEIKRELVLRATTGTLYMQRAQANGGQAIKVYVLLVGDNIL